MNPENWLAEIGKLLDDCLEAKDREATDLVRRFLDLMVLAPAEIGGLMDDEKEAIDPGYFELPALESLLFSQLGDAIGMCLSISASKNSIATAFNHRTETETTFESWSMPIAMTGAIAMLAERGVRDFYENDPTSRLLTN